MTRDRTVADMLAYVKETGHERLDQVMSAGARR